MIRVIFTSLSALILVSCSQTPLKPHVSAATAFEAYVAALNDGDIAKASSFYDTADGFHWIERGRVQYETGLEAANALKSLQSGSGKSKMTIDTLRVAELSDNAALLSTHFDFARLSETGVTEFSFGGWMTVGMVRRADGWKIAGGQTGPDSLE